MNNHTEVQSQPQADGDGRPIYNGSRLVFIRKSGPGFHSSLQKRDADLATLVEPMARLLFRALQVQALGAIDHITFEDLPVRAKNELVNEARIALHRQSPLYREEAKRASKLALHGAFEDVARHYPYLNPVADEQEIARRRTAITHAIGTLALLEVHKVLHEAHDSALVTPIRMGATAQVTLTALRGARL